MNPQFAATGLTRTIGWISLLVALMVTVAGGTAVAAPTSGPLADILLPGVEAAPPVHPLVFRFALLTDGGHRIDTTRVEVRAPGWDGAALVTLEGVSIRSNHLTGRVSFHNGSLEPLFGVRLDFGLRVETYRATDDTGRPVTRERFGPVEASTPLFLSDLARGEDTVALPFSLGPVGFEEETISVEFQAALTGYELAGVVSTADSLDLAPGVRGEGLDTPPRRVRAGELTQPARFSRCYCRIDSIAAIGADSRPLAHPPRVRAGAAPGGLNALVACDLDAANHVYVADREFARDDSTGAPLARITRFDALGRFVTAFGWGSPAPTEPRLPIGRLVEPEGLAALSDGRVLIQLKARPKKRPEILIFDPFPRGTPLVAPAAR